MKIKPSSSKSAPLYPTLVAMVGAVLTGCDKQKVPGIVPFEQNPTPSENQQQIPGSEGCKPSTTPEKLQTPPGAVGVQPTGRRGEPLKLGGEALNTPECRDSVETPEILGGDVPYTPDTDEE